MTRPDLIKSLSSVMPKARPIAHAFALMSIAETELAQSKLPSKGTNLFMVLCPPALLVDPSINVEVYRSHVRELLGRVWQKHDLRTPTNAELLISLSNTSLQAPLARPHDKLMARAFMAVFGHAPEGADVSKLEPYELEVLATVQKELMKYTKDRVLRPLEA